MTNATRFQNKMINCLFNCDFRVPDELRQKFRTKLDWAQYNAKLTINYNIFSVSSASNFDFRPPIVPEKDKSPFRV